MFFNFLKDKHNDIHWLQKIKKISKQDKVLQVYIKVALAAASLAIGTLYGEQET